MLKNLRFKKEKTCNKREEGSIKNGFKEKKLETVRMEAGTQCLGKKPFKERGKISRRTSIGN
jgi:hypothetical protein